MMIIILLTLMATIMIYGNGDNANVATSASDDESGEALLRAMKFPFKG